MREETRARAAEWAKIGRPPSGPAPGSNSGPMVVGNVGSKYQPGAQIHLVAHDPVGEVEGLNKVYRTEIIVGENTAQPAVAREPSRTLTRCTVIPRPLNCAR